MHLILNANYNTLKEEVEIPKNSYRDILLKYHYKLRHLNWLSILGVNALNDILSRMDRLSAILNG